MKKTKEKFVTTFKGEELPISKCRKFNKEYYKKGDITVENSGDCYLMEDGKYYRVETDVIVYNHSSKRYVFSSSFNLAKGFIDKDFKIGHFDYDEINNIVVHLKTGGTVLAISEEIVKGNLEYRECINDGEYYHISRKPADLLCLLQRPHPDLKNRLQYNSKSLLKGAVEEYEKYFIYEPNKECDLLGNFVGDYTFGFEFETVKGMIPLRHCKKLGLMPLRDGSIAGLEYATIPLKGAKGIQSLFQTVNLLKERTLFDEHCSIHMHIGGVPRTESFILAFFKTTLFIQDELFELFPLYKKYNYRYKNKNYTAPYDAVKFLSKFDNVINNGNIKRNFGILFNYLSRGVPYEEYGSDLNNVKVHPNDSDENHKWNVNTRYHLHNIIPIIFGNKQTIEFRLHTSTDDADKLILFLLLNLSILNYVKVYEKSILEGKRNINGLNEIIVNSGLNLNSRHQEALLESLYHRKDLVFQQFCKQNFYFNEDDIQPISFLNLINRNGDSPRLKYNYDISRKSDSILNRGFQIKDSSLNRKTKQPSKSSLERQREILKLQKEELSKAKQPIRHNQIKMDDRLVNQIRSQDQEMKIFTSQSNHDELDRALENLAKTHFVNPVFNTSGYVVPDWIKEAVGPEEEFSVKLKNDK
jgi:hypothetical protein